MRLLLLLLLSSPALSQEVHHDWPGHLYIPTTFNTATFSHWSYADASYTYDRGAGAAPYPVGPDGPYTHYVDPDHGSATDTANPYGSHTTPRVTMPDDYVNDTMAPGTVIEVHGDDTWTDTSPIDSDGTAAMPIFIRGPSTAKTLRTQTSQQLWRNEYMILENFEFDLNRGTASVIRFTAQSAGGNVSNNVVRFCKFRNGARNNPSSYQPIRALCSDTSGNSVTFVAVWANDFDDMGRNRDLSSSKDAVCVSLDASCSDFWIVGNNFHRIGGDGIQVAYDAEDTGTFQPTRVYIAANYGTDFAENLVDLKLVTHVIISQNVVYGCSGFFGFLKDAGSALRYSLGEGGSHFRDEIWTIHNTLYLSDSFDGMYKTAGSAGDLPSRDVYFIGNMVYQSDRPGTFGFALLTSICEDVTILNNGAYNVAGGYWLTGDTTGTYSDDNTIFQNNWCSVVQSNSNPRVLSITGTTASIAGRFTISHNLFFDDDGDVGFREVEYNPSPTGTTWANWTLFSAARPAFVGSSYNEDPDLVDPANGDFRLQSVSPCVEGGTNAPYNTACDAFEATFPTALSFRNYDLARRPRIVDADGDGTATIDIGPFEYSVETPVIGDG